MPFFHVAWRRTVAGRLVLQTGSPCGTSSLSRCTAVPDAVIQALRWGNTIDVTSDPAADLIRAESRWRLHAAHLENTAAQAYRTVVMAFVDLQTLLPTPGLLLDEWVDRVGRRAFALLRSALGEFINSCRALETACGHVGAVRQFVTGLDMPAGLLACARDGWRRDPTRPTFVSAYATEAVFVIADPRRAAYSPGTSHPVQHDWGLKGLVVAGEVFGVGWRRDGDDDDPCADEPAVLGPWQLGYIPATGEIYATRRCHYRDPQVWLLANGHTNPARTRRLLSELKRRMGEPNSLLLAAHATHHARSTRVDGAEPATTDQWGGAGEMGWR